ncbi:acyltransferase family protein [Quatrionicoccus australiensis]|uniref:acyltransferase family protein n=1 Tax=Quatrionicoccus australiensis TaxID=138118 RepID=UPI001CF85DEC|nr:acyltransferase [Quatrionicoccus australiensis]UCV15287.1 acyltransferase [Quatrionicoccus australiensis]
MAINSNRMPLIDALKAIAALLVLSNHFSSYGPLAAIARDAFPGLFGWLFEYGRMAVQIFLVIAGFLAARALSREGQALAVSPLPLLWKRYLRLAVPYLAAIGLAIAAAALADQWMDDEAIPARATFSQWLAHALLLHGVLGIDALSAGVWYIAIDFQLFALMAVLLWSGRIRILAPALVLLVATASLFWFNRDAELDNWAIYFFGSYGLGAAAWWASDRRQMSAWLGVIATVAIAALVVDFRLRIALALAVAMTLGFSRRTGLLDQWPNFRPLSFLGQISYSVFLVHFPVLLLANAVYTRLELDSPTSAILGLVAALTASLLAATAFYRWIESPAASARITAALGWLFEKVQELAGRLPLLGALFARRA